MYGIINLSTKDMTYVPSIIPTTHFEPCKEENLSKNKSAEFMSSPKVSFIQRYHCIIMITYEAAFNFWRIKKYFFKINYSPSDTTLKRLKIGFLSGEGALVLRMPTHIAQPFWVRGVLSGE